MVELSPETRAAMQQHVSDAMTISDKVRALHAAGYEKADIARFIERRYQQVYNILNVPGANSGLDRARPPGRRGRPKQTKRPVRQYGLSETAGHRPEYPALFDRWNWVDVRPDGSIVLPQAALDVLEVSPGERVQVGVEDNGAVVVRNKAAVLASIQARVAKYVKPGENVVDEFLAERRALWGEEDD